MKTHAWWLVALWAGAACTEQPSPAGTPLPLDPITAEEAVQAQRTVQTDARAGEMIGKAARLVYVMSIAPKLTPKDDEPRGRHAELLYIRSDNEFGVHVLVDIGAARVVDVTRVPSASVPLGRADVEEALRIASEDPTVRQLLGERASAFRVLTGPIDAGRANSDYVEGLRHTGSGPKDPCSRHRCVYLLFNSGGRLILQDREIVVDLTARQARVSTVRPQGDHR